MSNEANHVRWSRLPLSAIIFLLALGCQPPALATPPQAPPPVASHRPSVIEEPQPALAYCVPHPPSTDNIVFTLDYDGSDGTHEPRFRDSAFVPPIETQSNSSTLNGSAPNGSVPNGSLSSDSVPSSVPSNSSTANGLFSTGAKAICQPADKPIGRRYVLRVPINAEPRRLDEFVQFGARYGYDQPIIKVKDAVVAALITGTEYYYSPPASEALPEQIGTLTIESDADGNYELRARVTDGQERSEPIGTVLLPPKPDMADCESKSADAVRKLCAHESRPCERVALVGVNDIGPLVAVLGYVQAIAELALPAVSFQQRLSEADNHAYFDAPFRRAHRVKRFFASFKPEDQLQKVPADQSLARRKLGIHATVPKELLGQLDATTEVVRRLAKLEWTELGKSKTCDQPGRMAATLVVDESDHVRVYAERVAISDKSEMLLRAYYDDAQRLRLVVSSEATDSGEAWDAYLALGEDACPRLERIASRVSASSNMLHWELRALKNPRVAYSEPLCMGQLP